VWKEALKMRTAASLPSGCVIAFSVEDPRVYLAKKKALLNLPPLKDDYIIENHNWSVHSAKSELWDKSSRQAIIHAKSNKDKVKVSIIHFIYCILLINVIELHCIEYCNVEHCGVLYFVLSFIALHIILNFLLIVES
jgi:hypothetical protein